MKQFEMHAVVTKDGTTALWERNDIKGVRLICAADGSMLTAIRFGKGRRPLVPVQNGTIIIKTNGPKRTVNVYEVLNVFPEKECILVKTIYSGPWRHQPLAEGLTGAINYAISSWMPIYYEPYAYAPD